MTAPSPIPPDTKDWTWVLRRTCPDCGLDASAHPLEELADLLHDSAMAWADVLLRPEVARRPAPQVWSPLEYACHVRDVHVLFDDRLCTMLAEDAPRFAGWDQDVAAVAGRYDLQDPAEVAADLIEAAGGVAGTYASVRGEDRHRRGVRSDGDTFTVETLGQYHLHDVVHHLWDVRTDGRATTRSAYDVSAARYARQTADLSDPVRADLDALVDRLGAGARVLEIGSGGGRDAAHLEERGLRVRRTDVSAGFVALLHEQGHEADLLDPLTDDLAHPDGPYDAVWANASLLHVARRDLPVVLARLCAVTRPGGVLRISLKEGDGERWSTHGSVAAPRLFTYWREPALRDAVESSGWSGPEVERRVGSRSGDPWLELTAVRG